MKEKLYEVIYSSNKNLTSKDLEKVFSNKEQLKLELQELEEEGKIFLSNSNKYCAVEKTEYKSGIININKKGFGFVSITDHEEDIYISKDNILDSISGDIVLVQVLDKVKNSGKIIKVLKRNKDNIAGEVLYQDHKCFVLPIDKNATYKILLNRECSQDLVDGHQVLIKLNEKIDSNIFSGDLLKVIGHKDDPLVDVKTVAADYGFVLDLDEETIKQVEKIPTEVHEKDIKGRIDLRDLEVFTIDGNDTKDIDDAVSLEMLDNGNYKLGVHIADVTYYIKENTPLDNSAYSRATSVYLTNYVLPMIHHKLSNGICSLNEGEDRLTISCSMEFDKLGKLLDYKIYPSVILSRKKMNYDSVNKLLEENIIEEDYAKYAKTLISMNELAAKIRNQKKKRGEIEFLSSEAKIYVDENGKPIEIKNKQQRSGEKLIEDFMIVANETVATHIKNMDLPFIYRIHDKPKIEKIKKFLFMLNSLGYKINGDFSKLRPTDVQNVLKQLESTDKFPILSDLLLRCMQKAVYSNNNIGHFGLASQCYTHFTSPIRRYPDQIVHRLLRRYLFDYNYDNINVLESQISNMAQYCSDQERKAIECERDVNEMKMAEYMQEHIGEVYNGMVTGIKEFGMFVRLNNLVEGLVSKTTLGRNARYLDNVEQYRINNQLYKLGDKVKVKVLRASKNDREIDFELVKENGN